MSGAEFQKRLKAAAAGARGRPAPDGGGGRPGREGRGARRPGPPGDRLRGRLARWPSPRGLRSAWTAWPSPAPASRAASCRSARRRRGAGRSRSAARGGTTSASSCSPRSRPAPRGTRSPWRSRRRPPRRSISRSARASSSATAGDKDPLAIEPTEGGQRTRLAAHLPARPRLELTWRVAAEPGAAQLAPLLSARGEVALEVDRGSVRATSVLGDQVRTRGRAKAWSCGSTRPRGSWRLTLDGQPMPARGEARTRRRRRDRPAGRPAAAGGLVQAGLRRRGGPCRPGPWSYAGSPPWHTRRRRRASWRSRRKRGSGSPGRKGAGSCGSTRGGSFPKGLKRPAAALAYRFLDQPFALGLRAEASPSRPRSSTRTTLTIEATSAIVDAWVDYRVGAGPGVRGPRRPAGAASKW